MRRSTLIWSIGRHNDPHAQEHNIADSRITCVATRDLPVKKLVCVSVSPMGIEDNCHPKPAGKKRVHKLTKVPSMCYIQSVTAKLYNTLKTYRNVSAPRIRWGARGNTHWTSWIRENCELCKARTWTSSKLWYASTLCTEWQHPPPLRHLWDEAGLCSCTSTVSRHEKTAR
jgi:hypothetical protein